MARRRGTLVAAALAVAALAGMARAHDTWLLPSSLRVAPGQRVVLSLTSGMAFPVDDFPINPARIQRADVRLGGTVTPLGGRARRARSTTYAWTPATPGTAALAVELAPKVLELAPRLIPVYLDEIGAPPAVRAAWDAIKAPKRWRESYVKHAATFVRVGAGDDGWRAPLGLGFELVPQADPTALVAGDSLPLVVRRAGAPVPAQPVTLRHEGDTTFVVVTAGPDGRAVLRFPRDGRWLVAATQLRRSAAPGLEWESDFSTITLAVRAAR